MGIEIKADAYASNCHIIGSGITCREAILAYIDELREELKNTEANNKQVSAKINRIQHSMSRLSDRGCFYVNDIIAPSGERILSWNQISNLMHEVEDKGVLKKDPEWGAAYLEKELKQEYQK